MSEEDSTPVIASPAGAKQSHKKRLRLPRRYAPRNDISYTKKGGKLLFLHEHRGQALSLRCPGNQEQENSSSDWQTLIPKTVHFRPEKAAYPLFYFLFSGDEMDQASRIDPSLGRCLPFYDNFCHNSSRVQEMFSFFFY